MKSPIKKFKINRKKWLRSSNGKIVDSCLLNKEGKMCCLGFYSLARGINKKYIRDEACPNSLVRIDDGYMLPELINNRKKNNGIAARLMTINDAAETSDAHKEKGIKKNFKKLGVEVEFFG